MKLSRGQVCLVVALLLIVQAALVAPMVHRESLTFDEDNHMFAGYMMWKTADYGLNPEHPPLVKLLAALPVLREKLWIPPLQGRDFKREAYFDGRDWLAHNDGASQRMVFSMRMAVLPLALLLSLVVFGVAREWFGTGAALIAITLVVFDPNLLAHSGLVTTDMGVTLFFILSIWTFCRYATRPGPARLAIAGLAAGLLAATKHSGILLMPMLAAVILCEIAMANRGTRLRRALQLCGGFAAVIVIATLVLWSFYGFRYAARPAGLHLSSSLAQYVAPLSGFDQRVVMAVAHARLLPESYLMGLVDVKRMAQYYPTFILGHVYAHGVWWYFPVAILIKTTLGLLALVALAAWAAATGRLMRRRELLYLLVPGAVYFAIAMASGIDIGARHVLPLCAMAAVFAGAGASALCRSPQEPNGPPGSAPFGGRGHAWVWIVAVLIVAHAAESLAAYPNDIAFANAAWGGPANVHNLLSDANVDWAQQLYQVKAWQDRHPQEPCWFAYFARPEIDPAVYGIRCHALPTVDTLWLGGSDIVPPVVHGAVIISAGDLSGCEWASGLLNPYREFQRIKPAQAIDYGVFVYEGDFRMTKAAALSRAIAVNKLLREHQPAQALAIAQEAVTMAPGDLFAETALGDAEFAAGNKPAAQAAWQSALSTLRHMDPGAQESWAPGLQAKLFKT